MTTIKKLFIIFSFMLIAGAALADKKMTDLSVVLDWYVNPDHAPLVISQQMGFFAKQGLNVTLIPPANASDGPKMVAAGEADIAVSYQPHLVVAAAKGLPLVRIATLVNYPLNCLFVLKDGPIKTLRDLRGKRIAHPAGFSSVILKALLQEADLKLDDVQLVSMNYDLTQALMAHRIDGFTGGMRNYEAIEMKLNGQPARLFCPTQSGMPDYDELILITNKKSVQTAAVKKFLFALQQGMTYLKQHPEKSWDIFIKAYPDLNNKLNYEAWYATLPYFDAHPACLDAPRYKNFAGYLYKQGFIHSLPALNKYAVQIPENCIKA